MVGLSESDWLRLWEQASRQAKQCCRGTLMRLRRGEGGFYQADDLMQDLFIEFTALVQCWQARGESEAELWTAWRDVLWGGGWRILRRAPQRLWTGVEQAIEPARLALEMGDEYAFVGVDSARLPMAGAKALVQVEDSQATQARLGLIEALADALATLSVEQRVLLYLCVVARLSAAQAAACLGLRDAVCVHRRLYAVRRLLRQHLQSGELAASALHDVSIEEGVAGRLREPTAPTD